MAKVNQENQKPKGIILKEAREAKGISLEMVHVATKIPLDALKAIEEGYTVRSLSPFYVKGFMKMYAQYLGIDINQVVEDYHPEHLPKPVKEEHRAAQIELKFRQIFSQERQKQIFIAAAVLAVILLGITIKGSCRPLKTAGSATLSKSAALEAKKKAKAASEQTAVKKATSVSSSTEKKTETPAQAQPPKTVNQPVVSASSAEEKETVEKKVTVTVKAKKKVWIQVKADGNILFQSTLLEGSAETWQASKTIELAGKNMSFLEFEVNGKMVGSLGRTERDARRIIITKDGLSVKQ
jgi:cytoskeletal protein RodZ